MIRVSHLQGTSGFPLRGQLRVGQLQPPPSPHSAPHAPKSQAMGICHQNKWPAIPAGSKSWEQMVFCLNNCFEQQFIFQDGFFFFFNYVGSLIRLRHKNNFQCTDNKCLHLRESAELKLPTLANHHLPGLEKPHNQRPQYEILRGDGKRSQTRDNALLT